MRSMTGFSFGLVVTVLGGCVSDVPEPGNDSGADSTADGGVPNMDSSADGTTCTQAGQLACNTVLNAYCARLADCCTTGCGCSMTPNFWKCSLSACVAHFQPAMDCKLSTYAGRMVCEAKTNACLGDMQAVACTGVWNSANGNNGPRDIAPSCDAFWNQFM
jgi:hypothetical protein